MQEQPLAFPIVHETLYHAQEQTSPAFLMPPLLTPKAQGQYLHSLLWTSILWQSTLES